MSIRLDPRRLNTLRALAAEAGVRPGELVTIWVEERLDAERTGTPPRDDLRPVLDALNERVNALAARIDALAGSAAEPAALEPAALEPAAAEPAALEPGPRKRGRPRKTPTEMSAEESTPKKRGRSAKTKMPAGKRVPLHAELMAIIAERGPLSAADLAAAVVERGVYTTPRSAKPLDAATINARVSNPVYRSRFARADGKIGLAAD